MDTLVAPIVAPGFEPLAEGPRSDEERRLILQQMKQQRLITAGMESPVAKACISGAVGFGLGAFLSLIGSTFAFDDPFRAPHMQGLSTQLKAKQMFVDMGKGMWRQGKGFGMVGALYSGTECVVEGFRAKNDTWNAVYAGFISGGVLARNSGPRAMLLGGAGFALFSTAIEKYMRWDSPDEDA